MRIGLAQLNSQHDKAANLAVAADAMARLAAGGADLIVLPEMFNHHWTDEANAAEAETIPGPSTEWASDQARRHGVFLHLGSLVEHRPGTGTTPAAEPGTSAAAGARAARFNTSVVFGRGGEELGRYSKIHLFDVCLPDGTSYCESGVVTAGHEVVTVDCDDVTLGLAICYDLRFPELFRSLAIGGAHVLVIPAAFTTPTGINHWEPLLRARAIENGCYVAACGQWGPSAPGKAPCYGHSMVVDPWGVVIAQCSEGVTTVLAELDLEHLLRVRSRMPVLQHRRPDLFRATAPGC